MILATPPASPASSITSVVLQPGDFLSKIPAEYHVNVTLPELEHWNPEVDADPNLVYPGERIAVVLHGPHSPVGWTPGGYTGRHRASAPEVPAGDSEAQEGLASPPVTTTHAPAPSGGSSPGTGSTGSHPAADLAFQACVISAESGGNAQIWNGSGHWGLYQFSESTWIAFGGTAAEFGHADAARQTEVFWNAMASGNWYGTWGEWDGCRLA